jgi:hypothetical protein
LQELSYDPSIADLPSPSLSATLTASSKVVIYSSFPDKGGATCIQETVAVSSLLAQYDAPKDWTWVVVCDASAWPQVEKREEFRRQGGHQGLVLGATFLGARYTYIRGEYVLTHMTRLSM